MPGGGMPGGGLFTILPSNSAMVSTLPPAPAPPPGGPPGGIPCMPGGCSGAALGGGGGGPPGCGGPCVMLPAAAACLNCANVSLRPTTEGSPDGVPGCCCCGGGGGGCCCCCCGGGGCMGPLWTSKKRERGGWLPPIPSGPMPSCLLLAPLPVRVGPPCCCCCGPSSSLSLRRKARSSSSLFCTPPAHQQHMGTRQQQARCQFGNDSAYSVVSRALCGLVAVCCAYDWCCTWPMPMHNRF